MNSDYQNNFFGNSLTTDEKESYGDKEHRNNAQISSDNNSNENTEQDPEPVNQDWLIFLEEIKKPKSETAKSRKTVPLDDDLHKTISELDIKGLPVSHLVNVIVRSFIEGNAKELLKWKLPVVRNILDKYSE